MSLAVKDLGADDLINAAKFWCALGQTGSPSINPASSKLSKLFQQPPCNANSSPNVKTTIGKFDFLFYSTFWTRQTGELRMRML